MSASVQLFEPLTAPTEAALRASIERFGVIVPIVRDQHGRILDQVSLAFLAHVNEVALGFLLQALRFGQVGAARAFSPVEPAPRRDRGGTRP